MNYNEISSRIYINNIQLKKKPKMQQTYQGNSIKQFAYVRKRNGLSILLRGLLFFQWHVCVFKRANNNNAYVLKIAAFHCLSWKYVKLTSATFQFRYSILRLLFLSLFVFVFVFVQKNKTTVTAYNEFIQISLRVSYVRRDFFFSLFVLNFLK